MFTVGVKQQCNATSPSFAAKGGSFLNFLFAYLEDKVFRKWGLLLKERICSKGSKFCYELMPIYMGGNNENDTVASPESVPIYLNFWGIRNNADPVYIVTQTICIRGVNTTLSESYLKKRLLTKGSSSFLSTRLYSETK